MLNRSQFDAVAAASLRLGVPNAYFVGFGGEDAGWGGTHGHSLVDLGSYDDYRLAEGASALEHFLFAPGGEWGLVTSDGEYALVGGQPTFIADLRDRLSYDQEAVIRSFVSEWREAGQAGASIEWVPPLLDQVLGPDKGLERWNA